MPSSLSSSEHSDVRGCSANVMLAADPMLGGSKEIRNMEFEAAQAGQAVRWTTLEISRNCDYFRGNPEDDRSMNPKRGEPKKGDLDPCRFAHSPNLRTTIGSPKGKKLAP